MSIPLEIVRTLDYNSLDSKTFFILMFLSGRNQSIDLYYKLIDWFLYEWNIGMKKN